MTHLDAINAAFEMVGAVTCWRDVHALCQARRAVGVHWQSRAFFAAWGMWNLVYYPSLGQWLSFGAGLAIVTANAVWVGAYLYFARTNPRVLH